MRDMLKNELMLLLDKIMDTETLKTVEPQIECILSNYEVEKRKTDMIVYGSDIPETVEAYIVSKKICGLSKDTLYLYLRVLIDFFRFICKNPEDVTANDIRVYLYRYQEENDVSNRTLDCRRTIICTYFNWMAAEEYISRNPAVKIQPIKYERKHRKPMSQIDLEKIRLACRTKREKAIVEVFYSTGCRVSELEHLNKSDINFETNEVILYGKGNKHRTGFLNPRAHLALKDYLDSRDDTQEALFVRERKPHDRLKKPGIELVIRNIMERVPDASVHVTPHIFRHTTATTAIDRGMDVVAVSKILGHERIDTTMEYITTDNKTVKDKHKNVIV